MNNEKVYDEEIRPLVKQILETCKQHRIGMVMAFHIATDEKPALVAQSLLVGPETTPAIKLAGALMLGAAKGTEEIELGTPVVQALHLN